MRKITKISIILITLGWFPFMWLCAFGLHQSDDVKIAISMSGLFICLFASMISLLGAFGNNAFWSSLKDLDDKIKAYVDAKKAYELAEKRLINTTLELEREKSKYKELINDEESKNS